MDNADLTLTLLVPAQFQSRLLEICVPYLRGSKLSCVPPFRGNRDVLATVEYRPVILPDDFYQKRLSSYDPDF